METDALEKLIERCGADYVARRLSIQIQYSADMLGPGIGSFHFENSEKGMKIVGAVLRLLGVWRRGHANIWAHKIVHNVVRIPKLSSAFEGFKILHLSDLHLDVSDGFSHHLGRLISHQDYDLALITGDFRFKTHGNYYPTLKAIEILSEYLKCGHGSYSILGNHDFLEFVPTLEMSGIRTLLNETVRISKDGAGVWLIGLDDAHFYGVHNYKKAFEKVDVSELKILMIHSPETLEEAWKYGPDFIVTGHTHAGQICLPTGIPLWLNSTCDRYYCRGAWKYKGIPGYTSAGTGSSGLPIRFNCPPEIVIHHLTSSDDR
ncbi:MAG: metallophosphoesterase [Desulfomonilaceae bacterium]